MKKILTCVLIVSLCVGFSACAKEQEDVTTTTTEVSTTAVTTTTEPATSTTAQPKSDEAKGEQLKTSVISALGNQDGAKLDGDLEHGSFTYNYSRSADIIYANERSEEIEQLAKENADNLANVIKEFYSDDITLSRENALQIGSSDNGIDSVQYQFFYTNTQNQQLKIYADSDGIISFVQCNFTW
jgi:uncharacterized protein YxeA